MVNEAGNVKVTNVRCINTGVLPKTYYSYKVIIVGVMLQCQFN